MRNRRSSTPTRRSARSRPIYCASLGDYAGCRRLPGGSRWRQPGSAAPPAGYYYPELVAHPVVVTNFRGVYNDHIATHILAFVLAFSRGLHRYIPNQARREWRSDGLSARVVHLPEATALIVGVGGIGGETA